MCKLYCPTDALFVAPEADKPVQVTDEHLSEANLLSSYRAAVGWRERTTEGARGDRPRAPSR